MNDEKTPAIERTGNPPNAEYRRFDGLREYEEVIDNLIPQTQRTIRVFDRVLSRAWNTPQRYEALRQFCLANRMNRLLIVVHDAEPVERDCPRMIDLVRHFGTVVRIHETLAAAKQIYDPFVVFDASHYLHRFHYRYLRAAHGSHDVIGAQQLLDRFSEIWDVSAHKVIAGASGL